MKSSSATRTRVILLAALICSAPALRVLADEPPLLTLQEAEQTAIRNHPRISIADLVALGAKQDTRAARSAFYPVVTAYATAVGVSGSNTRIAAGAINNPQIFERNAEGVNVGQLITDFGRTANLTDSAKSHSRAEEEQAVATRAEILLAVDAAYFDALQAQAVAQVAKQTVDTRQITFDRVNELAKNKLKSDLDVSFARVNLEQSKVLLASAENDLRSTAAVLSNLLGEREQKAWRLKDEAVPPVSTPDPTATVQLALHDRPDLARLRFDEQSAESFARAERKLHYPTINAMGSAGVIPIGDPTFKDHYAAAGVNLTLPVFDGMLFTAREEKARLAARAAVESVRDAENNVIRDVRVAILNLDYAARQKELTADVVASAQQAFQLAQARYDAGSSSIVELSQAQLNLTEAEIAAARARYEYQTRAAVLKFQTGQLR